MLPPLLANNGANGAVYQLQPNLEGYKDIVRANHRDHPTGELVLEKQRCLVCFHVPVVVVVVVVATSLFNPSIQKSHKQHHIWEIMEKSSVESRTSSNLVGVMGKEGENNNDYNSWTEKSIVIIIFDVMISRHYIDRSSRNFPRKGSKLPPEKYADWFFTDFSPIGM